MDSNLIYLATMDFKLVYKAHIILNNEFRFEQKLLTDDLSGAKLVITTVQESKEISHPNSLILDSHISLNQFKSEVIRKLMEPKLEIKECIVGIDPGKSIGVSIFYMGKLLTTNVFTSPSLLINWLTQELKEINYSKLTIRVGNGNLQSLENLMPNLVNTFESIAKIEEVNEFRTSIRSDGSRTLHEEAAILIAKRSNKTE